MPCQISLSEICKKDEADFDKSAACKPVSHRDLAMAFSDAKNDQCRCSRDQHKDTLQAWQLMPLLEALSSTQQHTLST